MKKRLFIYFLGLFIMTIGIGISLKSDLGVTPISSIPYMFTLIVGIEMGKATILLHIALIFMQIAILRRDFKFRNMAQLVVAIIFGYFITFSNYLMTFLPTSENYAIRFLLLLLSIILIALGIFLYMSSNIMPLAAEGATQAISQKTGIAFPKVKVAFDSSMVIISAISCLLIIKKLGSVGVGTIISAMFVGTVLNFIAKLLRPSLDRFLNEGLKNNRTGTGRLRVLTQNDEN